MPATKILQNLTISELTGADVDAFTVTVDRDPAAAHKLGLEALAVANPGLLPRILELLEAKPNIDPLALMGILAVHAHNQALEEMLTPNPNAGDGA